jgi:hypothetical protein
MVTSVARRRSAGLVDQLVLLPTRYESDTAVAYALDEAREARAVDVRDAAVFTLNPPEVRVTEPSGEWPGRKRLGSRWWSALAHTLTDVGRCSSDHGSPCFRHLVDTGMSRSFLQEAAMALAASPTTIVLLVDRIDVRSLLVRLEDGHFTRVIYGSLPSAAIDELAIAGE